MDILIAKQDEEVVSDETYDKECVRTDGETKYHLGKLKHYKEGSGNLAL